MLTNQKLGTSELLFRCAQNMGLQPTWVTPNGMFAVSVNGQERYINFGRSPFNSQNSASIAEDKYLTRLVLARHTMANIPFTQPRTQKDAKTFLDIYKKIIAKPVKGAGAQDIHIVTDASQLQALHISKYILEQYIAGQEMRYLVLNGRVIGVHRSEYGTSVDEHRELQRISYPRTAWNPFLVSSSLRIADVLDLHFAAIDFLVDASGRAHILEVNTRPGFKWFHAPTSGPVVDVARHFLESIFEEQPATIPAITPLLGVQPTPAYT